MKTRFLSTLMFLAFICTSPEALQASYTVNGTDINDLFNGPQGQITASSGNTDDTVILTFGNNDLSIRWGQLGMDAQGKNSLGSRKLEAGSGLMLCPDIECGRFTDQYGFLGGASFDTLNIKARTLSCNQTSLSFKSKAIICGFDDSPSIIRSLSVTKAEGTNYPIVMGQVDFTRKDNNFSGTTDFPHFAISGIGEISFILDKGKIN